MRPAGETGGMTGWKRRWKKAFRTLTCKKPENDGNLSYQYTIPPRQETKNPYTRCGIYSEKQFKRLTRFQQKCSFATLITSQLALYFVSIGIFMVLIYGIELAYENAGIVCTTRNEFKTSKFSFRLLQSFTLSWTTFSTVVRDATRRSHRAAENSPKLMLI